MEIQEINLLILSLFFGIYILILQGLDLFQKFPKKNADYFTVKPRRIGFFDFAKGIAIIAVIIIHATRFINFLPETPDSFLIWNEGINRIMRFAISVFFITSGALLFIKDIKKFYFNKIKRILVPYAFFSFAATYFFSVRFDSFSRYIITAVRDFFTGQALVPYWFVIVLFQFYLISPFLLYLFKKVRTDIILFTSFVFSLASYFLIPLISFPFFGNFLFFFVLGISLKPFFFEEKREWLNKIHPVYWFFFVLLLYLSIGMLQPFERYYNVRLVYGPAVMLFLFYIYPLLPEIIKKKIEKIGEKSLYIYLLHFIITYSLTVFIVIFKAQNINPFILFSGLAVFTFIITYTIIIGSQKLLVFLLNAFHQIKKTNFK